MTPPPNRPLRVAVCVLTYMRPRGITRLLESVANLEVPADCAVSVVVVDNDPDGSGCAEVSRRFANFPFPLRCVVEPRRGIPQARNRAVAESRPSDLVAFVDDDEVCDRRWLVELVRTHRETGADVVDGRVNVEFEAEPPPWVVEGGFFERPRFPTGHVKTWSTTTSVLISRDLLDSLDGPFDERFALTGGEDTHLFQRARLQGRRMVHNNEAVTVETIPATRTNLRWILRREFRRGNTLSVCLRELEYSLPRAAKRVAAALVSVTWGIVSAVPVRGRAASVTGLRRIAFGLGELAGLTGVHLQEYRTTHGS